MHKRKKLNQIAWWCHVVGQCCCHGRRQTCTGVARWRQIMSLWSWCHTTKVDRIVVELLLCVNGVAGRTEIEPIMVELVAPRWSTLWWSRCCAVVVELIVSWSALRSSCFCMIVTGLLSRGSGSVELMSFVDAD